MGKFTVIPKDTFEKMQLNAGVLLKTFAPENVAAPQDTDIICPTTGGISVTCKATYRDAGADVDNCPESTKELMQLTGWECKLGFTSLDTSPESIKMSLGAADVEGNKIIPRRDLKQSDFSDVWWVGDRADGGVVAVQVKNALSTGGFSLKTEKNGNGQNACELTGHVSINDQNTMPMVFYSIDPA